MIVQEIIRILILNYKFRISYVPYKASLNNISSCFTNKIKLFSHVLSFLVMDTFKISLLAFLAITTVALSSAAIHKNEKSPNPKKFNFQSLSGKDKMVLHLMSKIHPEAFRALPLHIFSEINEYAYISSIDNFLLMPDSFLHKLWKFRKQRIILNFIGENATIFAFGFSVLILNSVSAQGMIFLNWKKSWNILL